MADSMEASSSSSDDSDDDFLTTKGVDREALVRKKLLENFYGKSAVAEQQVAGGDEQDSDNDLEEDDANEYTGSVEDLDSPDFDAIGHARRHIQHSSIHTLLETEERLALQVRTLDSTMQTLVYENYSRFIDATDAIRSIGVNVTANEQGLERLSQGMQSMDERSKAIEDALGSLRDQVAEKIRVKRLLTRLDALLRLPATLREEIAAGKYRAATKNYLSASSILAKHSQGFESLKTIETECHAILEELKIDLKNRLLLWSGRATSEYEEASKSIADVFECAGTLSLLLSTDPNTFDDLTMDDVYSLSLSACMRLLDRILDTHMIEVQERRFESPLAGSSNNNLELNQLSASVSNLQPTSAPLGESLVPREVLDGILETASLFRSSFNPEDSEALTEFVSESFSTFVVHVRAILLEESILQSAAREDAAAEEGTEEVDSAHEEISGALAILVQSVSELAAGLAAPDVGINPDYAASLVDQVTDLTESMIRRRVDQRFLRLRLGIMQTCLVPFVERAIQERASANGKSALRAIAQIGSSTLSDCLQLVDDSIRSIFASGETSHATEGPILKDAVQGSTRRFAWWLASTLEILAGGESSDPLRVIEAAMPADGGGDEASRERASPMSSDMAESLPEDKAVLDLINRARSDLMKASGDSDGIDSDFVLGIAELCRLAESSVLNNLNQSIATHLGGGKKKQRGLFPSGKSAGDVDKITECFQMACSRLLVLYASSRGNAMVEVLVSDFAGAYDAAEPTLPLAPRPEVLEALAIAKRTCLECASLFGGDARAGPVPALSEGSLPLMPSPMITRKKGLSLDIERIFKEKIQVYPHPWIKLDASRDALLGVAFRVALRALLEYIRLGRLSAAGYQQLMVDVEFVKLLTSHYTSHSTTSLESLLSDVVSNAADRCRDDVRPEDVLQEARQAVRAFSMDDDERYVIIT